MEFLSHKHSSSSLVYLPLKMHSNLFATQFESEPTCTETKTKYLETVACSIVHAVQLLQARTPLLFLFGYNKHDLFAENKLKLSPLFISWRELCIWSQ